VSVAPDIHITPRELEVITWMAEGKTASEIGTILSLSEHTVTRHAWTVRLKLDAVNSIQLIAKAIRGGIIT
jgi:LuxR family transcriptional regulator, transcriptional regulator of spore coat protein